MRWIWLAVMCAFALGAQAQEVWRWVDENGVVHFQDRPRPGAEKVELKGPQTFTAPPVAPRRTEPEAPAQPEAAPGYTGFRIVAPAQGETLWNIGARLPVQLQLEPGLRPGHRLQLYLDGQRRDDIPQATQFVLSEVYRGEHQLRGSIVDSQGREVASTETVTFYVQQASIQNPNRPRP